MNIQNIIKKSLISVVGSTLAKAIFAGFLVGICLLGIVMPRATCADFASTTNAAYVAKISGAKNIKVVVTAYSSTPDQTDDTPFITASGKHVAEDIVANNMLPMGTKIKIPALYGDKVFTIGDRMNKKKSNYHIDLWMPSRALAINFGVKTTTIQVLAD